MLPKALKASQYFLLYECDQDMIHLPLDNFLKKTSYDTSAREMKYYPDDDSS